MTRMNFKRKWDFDTGNVLLSLDDLDDPDIDVLAALNALSGPGMALKADKSWVVANYPARLEPASYTYNADGSVATETAGGATTTYAYNTDGSIRTATRSGVTLTYSYNADGTVSGAA